MSNWLGDLFNKGYRSVTDLVTDVRNGVSTFWDDVTGLAQDARSAEGWMLNAVETWASKERAAIGSIYTMVRRVVEVRIPNLIGSALNNVISWVSRLVGSAINEYRTLIGDLRAWALNEVNSLSGWVNRVIAWADGRLHSLESWLNDHGKWITQLLSDPEILAEWLLQAMFKALMRYAQANGEAIVRYLVRNAVPLAGKAGSDIESYIHDIL